MINISQFLQPSHRLRGLTACSVFLTCQKTFISNIMILIHTTAEIDLVLGQTEMEHTEGQTYVEIDIVI